MLWDVEYTDTFGGEANYSWVRRAQIETGENATTREIMRKARAAVSLTGIRGEVSQLGEGFELRPHRMCTVMFVTPNY